MKNKHLFVAGAIASLLTISCSKENMETTQPTPNSSEASYKTDANIMAENTINNAWEDYNAHTHAEIIERIELLKEKLTSTSIKGASTMSGGEEPVSEIFTIYEGYFNHENGNFGQNGINVEKIPFTFENIPVHQNTDGNMYIYNTDLTQFHMDVAAQLGLELNSRNGKTSMLTDFDNITFSPDLTSATITGHFIIYEFQPFFTPGGAYFGAEHLGVCQTADHSADAANFIQAYLNNTINHNCTNGYTVILFTLVNTDVSPNPPYTNFHAAMNPLQNCWYDDINTCIGDDADQNNNNAIWSSWYNKANNLRVAGLNYAQSIVGAPSNLKFVTTDYHSHIPGEGTHNFSSTGSYIADKYFHAGNLWYGTIICN